ncbi:MAG: hypothetical protein QM488_03560 [Rhizobiaceae bacterium]
MPKTLSITVLALALFTVTFAVNLQAPLYDVYAAESNVGATADLVERETLGVHRSLKGLVIGSRWFKDDEI